MGVQASRALGLPAQCALQHAGCPWMRRSCPLGFRNQRSSSKLSWRYGSVSPRRRGLRQSWPSPRQVLVNGMARPANSSCKRVNWAAASWADRSLPGQRGRRTLELCRLLRMPWCSACTRPQPRSIQAARPGVGLRAATVAIQLRQASSHACRGVRRPRHPVLPTPGGGEWPALPQASRRWRHAAIPPGQLGARALFRKPKGHERRIHGHRHAGVRIVQEGPTLLLALDAHGTHPEPFTAHDLEPYQDASAPPCQVEALHRRKIMRKARAKKTKALLADLERRYLNAF